MVVIGLSGRNRARSDVVLFDEVQHEVKSSSLLAIVSHSDGGAASHLAGDAFLVELALAEPLAQL